ncbi:MAG: nitroreductase/quinone reductase family protein [Candidatus Limnocylindrales bacterium]
MQVPRPVLRLFWAYHRLMDRLTGGRFDTTGTIGPSVWLTTVGRRSGTIRETAVTYLAVGEDLVIVASNVGEDEDPSWWRNLKAAPDTIIRLPSQPPRPVHAREAVDPERSSLWARFIDRYPQYQGYQRRTSRRIPVIVLEPRDTAQPTSPGADPAA